MFDEVASLNHHMLIGLPLMKRGPAYTGVRLAETIDGGGVHSQIFAAISRWPEPGPSVPLTTGSIVSARLTGVVPYRLSRSVTSRLVERRLLRAVQSPSGGHPIVHTLGEVSLDLARRLKEEGVPVIREKINCAKSVAKRILDEAYGAIGVAPGHRITPALIEKEREELELADGVFCPSPMVAKSLIEIGIPEEKLLAASYGWEPERFAGSDRALPPVEGFTFLFVGFACVRKGVHILLEAWRQADVNGRLVIVGDIEPIIAERFADVLSRDDVTYMEYTDNVGALYRSADWFVFPTLEEGSALVVYEAAGNGVPALTSEMGAGGVIRDGLDGVIVDSDNPGMWASAIATAAASIELQRAYAESARERAMDFTWANVGARRRQALLGHFSRT